MPSSPSPLLTETDLPDLEMILVEGGTFLMGGQDDEVNDRELPVQKVMLENILSLKGFGRL